MSDSEESHYAIEDEDDPVKDAKFAAVKFFCEENRKIHYVAIKDIENFVLHDYSKPKSVKYKIDSHGNNVMEPAQILAVAGQYFIPHSCKK